MLMWTTVGMAIAALRLTVFATTPKPNLMLACGAIAGLVGGVVTQLVSRDPWSELAIFCAGVLATVVMAAEMAITARHRLAG